MKASQFQRLEKLEANEKHIRDLESNSAISPARLRGSSHRAGGLTERTLSFEQNEKKTVVSLPIKIEAVKNSGWFEMEERFFKEFDKIRDVSLKLLLGPLEKEKRLGSGEMEEKVFTVAPFVDSRVELTALVDSLPKHDSTFYNASWIGKEFIGCAMPQGARAREAFWRMIYEYDVPAIVMLNEDSEGYKRHPDIQRYVPNVLKEWESYGIVEVLKTEQVTARNMSTTVRKIKIRRKDDPDKVKELTHLQYIDWPDGGIPSDREDYREFMEYLLKLSGKFADKHQPICVHW